MTRIQGSCLCGAVAFEAIDTNGALELCHCTRCRKVSGSMGLATIAALRATLRFLRGQELIRAYTLPLRDVPPPYGVHFCGRCSSPVPDPDPEAPMVEIPAGSLDTPLGRGLDRHVYVEHRADWAATEGDAPRCTREEVRALRAERVFEIRTPRLLLRRWRDEDLPAFAAMCADERVMEFFPETLDRRESEALAARIRGRLEQMGWGLWAVEVPGDAPFIGFVGLSSPPWDAHFTPCIEIGWRLAADQWGRGYATEAAEAVLRFGFDELGLDEIVALTTVQNRRSRRVMAKLGMTYDPADDFDHPNLALPDPLRPHVVYRARAERVGS